MWLQTTNFFVAGQRYLIRRIEERPNIVLQTNTEIVALEGDDHLESIRWKKNRTGQTEERREERRLQASQIRACPLIILNNSETDTITPRTLTFSLWTRIASLTVFICSCSPCPDVSEVCFLCRWISLYHIECIDAIISRASSDSQPFIVEIKSANVGPAVIGSPLIVFS